MSPKVVILHYAAPPIVGGVEATIYHHAKHLAASNYEVEIVAGRGEPFDPQVTTRIIPEIDSRHPEIIELGKQMAAAGQPTEQFTALRTRLVESLSPLLAEAQVCIVHNALTLHKNLPLTAALHDLAAQEQVEVIAWCHDFAWQDHLYLDDLHPVYPWTLLRKPWPGVTYVAVSKHRQKRLADLLEMSPEKIHVINPGVDMAHFLRLEPLSLRLVDRLNLLTADPLLLLPARITRRKNIEFGIHVIAELTATLPEVKLVITGPPGPHNPKNQVYLENLQSLSHTLGVTDQVAFLYQYGENNEPLHIPDAVMADFFQLADALFFPSLREGFGIPVLEAGLVRLPIFAADIPPVRESAGRWAHLFNPEGDPRKVARQITVHLKENPAYHLKQRVMRKYTWRNLVREQILPLICLATEIPKETKSP